MVCIFIYKCLNASLLLLLESWFKSSFSIHEHKTRLNYNIKSELIYKQLIHTNIQDFQLCFEID